MDFTQNIEFASLIGDELTQVRIGQFIAHFLFQGGSEITVESSFEHVGSDGEVLSKYEIYNSCGEFTAHKLLGKKVASVQIESEDVLSISFENMESLRIVRNQNRLESCSLLLGRKLYVIS
jgi:hypothetical protein